ncbi:DUF3168 domain-containing protein [Rhizobium sp. FKL33]|uniref:DUF3168 domain-containing protein n=1 Tax=Rhizobium sp. FKL33 TaxID=2562307 RepID=UPI0010C14435|nr:DUF3168 domain-containing protein [Rhizobium sp. FKL33]
MLEPTLALQKAIGDTLINTPAVTALVTPDHIRAGSTRPENLPEIIMSGGQTIFLGNASGSQLVARVYLDLHVWAIEDGAETAKHIGFAVCNALKIAPKTQGFSIDEFQLPAIRWMRDPDPALNYVHGVITAEAVVRWKV